MTDDADNQEPDQPDSGPPEAPKDGEPGEEVRGNGASGDGAATVASRLIALQQIDTESDQATVRRQRLPERDDLATRTKQMNRWEEIRTDTNTHLAEVAIQTELAEATSEVLGVDQDRLEGQLKTVFAPREAEALMVEIDTIKDRRDDLFETQYQLAEDQGALEGDLAKLLAEEESLRNALGQSDDALGRACADIDAALAQLARQRSEALAEMDNTVTDRYEAVRRSVGVAVAELKGHRCEGCHIDLSAAEVDTAKEEAAETGFTDCPQCGRILIV